MGRLILLLTGALGVYFAWALVNEAPAPARKRVKATDAAEKLRQAWADHHTTA